MSLTPIGVEIRAVETENLGRFAFPCVYVSETVNDISTSGELLTVSADLANSFQGSVYMSIASDDNFVNISPISTGNFLNFLNTAYSIEHYSTTSWNMYKNNYGRFASYSSPESAFWSMFAVHTSDGYTTYQIQPHSTPSTYSNYYTLNFATQTKLGYYLSFGFTTSITWGGFISRSTFFKESNDIYNQSEIFIADTDPYSDLSDNTTTGGGGGIGTAADTSDTISDPSVPDIDAVSTGFVNLYKPTLAQIQSLGNYMWSSAFDLDSFKKLFANPMDSILGLSIMGVSAPSGGDSTVTVGNISTGVSMTELGSQFFKVDCGSLNVQEIWGAYIDYAPYTKCSIYLPFIGTHPLNVDEIMNKTVHLIYTFDALSGACIANLQSGGSVLYSFIGQCSASIPISGNDFTSMINGVITIAGSVGSMVASGGATAPLVLPAMASTVVNSLKPEVEHSGAVSGSGGIMGVKTPYLIFDRPRQAVPKHQNRYIGYPSYITENIGDLSGYTVFEEIKLQGNSHATSGELEEIDNIMKEGVYL